MKFVDINFNTKRLEQDINNEWQWEWLNKMGLLGQNQSKWLRKPDFDIAEVGFCEACCKTVLYKSNWEKGPMIACQGHRPQKQSEKSQI